MARYRCNDRLYSESLAVPLPPSPLVVVKLNNSED